MFRSRKTNYHIGGAFGMGRMSRFMLLTKLGWIDERSEYTDLKREIAFTKTFGSLGWQWLWRSGKQWLLEWSGDAAYFHNRSKRIVMPYAVMDKKRTRLVNDTYAAKTAHLWSLGTQYAVYHHPRQWKGVGLFLQAAFTYSHTTLIHQVEADASIGVLF